MSSTSVPILILMVVVIAFVRLAFRKKIIRSSKRKSDQPLDENILDHFQDQ